jgi:riboflavin biosynthesis pyrimidine reductase
LKVISNTAISLDGRIATARYDHVAIGSPTDRQYMSVLRARADAVLVGGRTFRNWPLPLVPDAAAIAALAEGGFFDAEAPDIRGKTWINAVVTRDAGLAVPPSGGGRFWSDTRVQPLFFVAGAADSGRVVGVTEPGAVCAELERRGVRTLLLECGGDLLFQFLAAGCVDEVYVTLCPLVLGGAGAPTLADGAGFAFAGAPRLRLEHAVSVGGEVYCRYSVVKEIGA